MKVTALLLLSVGCFLLLPVVQCWLVDAVSGILNKPLNRFFWSQAFFNSGVVLCLLPAVFLLTEFFSRLKKIRISLLIASLLAVYFCQLMVHVSAVPLNDDYFSVIGFANAWKEGDVQNDKFDLLFSFHGECRLVFTHLYTITFLKMFGHLPVKVMLVVLNCCLLLISWLFYRNADAENRRFTLLFACLLLFQFSFYDAQTWLTPALHYQFSLLFVFLFLHFLQKSKAYHHVLSLIFALLAVLTFGNGFLVFPLAVFYFLHKRNWLLAALWVLLAVLCAFLYFFSYTSYAEVGKFSFLNNFGYSCCFLGGSFQFFHQLYVPLFAGLFIWTFFVYLIWKKYYLRNYFLFGLLGYVIGSSLIAGFFRLHAGIEESISNRYGIFSVLAICCSVFVLHDLIRAELKLKFRRVALTSAFVFYLGSFFFYFPEIPQREKILNEFSDFFAHGKKYENSPVIPPQADSIMREAVKRNVILKDEKDR